MNKIAICQPYFAPYIGYFQLINAVDVFVSYDDVNFINRGWINRNKIMVANNEKTFTIPLKNRSQFKKINETMIDWQNKDISKLVKTLQMNYSKAKYKDDVLDIVSKILDSKVDTISELALVSLQQFCNYLDIDTTFKVSSIERYEKTDDRVKNLVNICYAEGAHHYVNPIGGTKLYNKEEFRSHGIRLNFLEGSPSLSIIDVCMSIPKEEIKDKLTECRLI
jgi:hypothetical protein